MTTKLIEQAELVEVSYNDAKVTLTFLDESAGEIREVNWNKKVFDKDTDKFVANDEKAAQVEEWSQEHFGLPFDQLDNAVGTRKDVYCYEKFNSLWEVDFIQLAKFDADMVGQILNGTITDVTLEDEGIRIYVDYEGETYRNNMGFTKQVAGRWFADPNKKVKQIDKFADKFGVPVEDAAELIGKSVMFEVKKMGGSNAIYIDVKPFPKKKVKK